MNEVFFSFCEDSKNKILELVRNKKKEKMEACFSLYNENFDDYAKCLHPFERVLNEKQKFIDYTIVFLKYHHEKCRLLKKEEQIANCLHGLQNLGNTLFLKFREEIRKVE